MRHLLIFVSLMICLNSHSAFADETAYTFGIVPQQASTILAKRWGPILRELSEKSGHKLVFRTATNIPTFESRVRAGEYDFAYMNPVHYTIFSNNPGYRAFAKQKGKRIKGILVVRKDSLIRTLPDLKESILAFPAPAAFAASVLPRGSLAAMHVAFEPRYVGSHDSVYRSVAKGLFIAGGGIQRTFETVEPEIRENLRVLWTSDGFTPHAFAAHPDLPVSVERDIQKAFVEMINDPVARKLLTKIGFKQGVEVARHEDWNDVQDLGFNELPR